MAAKGTRSTFGTLMGTVPSIITLPVSSGNPTEIAIPNLAAQLVLAVYADMDFTWHTAGAAAAAKTIIDASYVRASAGERITLPVAGFAKSIYVRSTGTAATTGLAYFFVQED